MKTAKDVHFPIRYTDADGNEINIVVSLAVAKIIFAEEDEVRYSKQKRLYHTDEGYVESATETNAFFPLPQTEDKALLRLSIQRASEMLTETQRRRMVAHYLYGHTYREIARYEKVSLQSVHESIRSADEIMKKHF